MSNEEKINKFMQGFDLFWAGSMKSHEETIRTIVTYYLSAGSKYADLPANVPNLVGFLNAAVRGYWTRGDMSAEEAIKHWSDANQAISSDMAHDVASLMCLVYRIMRGNHPSAMAKVFRLTTIAIRKPELTVWELMCEVPIFF